MARTKPRSDKVLTIRIPEKDLRRLEAFCILQEKTKTEVIRGFIRQLEVPETVELAEAITADQLSA
ncbi:MAG: hypothetical protein HC812_10625 [Leptolyngbya sp. RL_3_1]|nr:hypothetical protein [Leptolyngbya sp. RL_3_1]